MGVAPITTSETPDGTTHEGGAGYSRDVKSDLFLLGVSNFVGENTFYEKAGTRDSRFKALVREATLSDPEWVARFLAWLRNEANMRSASLVGAAEFLRARQENKLSGLSRQVISSVIQRADEPGEMLAYWAGNYGRNFPQPLKRGVADACTRVISEYTFHKYNKDTASFRIADVLDLVHPTPKDVRQNELFAYAVAKRHGLPTNIDETLPITHNREEFLKNVQIDPSVLLNQTMVRDAGLTHENVLSLGGDKVEKRLLWESVIPNMGYMALLRNLRNFDQAGIRQDTKLAIGERLRDPEQVAKSRQLPFRFLSAYKEVGDSAFWSFFLEQALDLSLKNIPEFKGKTFILVDTSGSMEAKVSAKSKISMMEVGALFGAALAQSKDAVLMGFANRLFTHEVYPGNSVLSTTKSFIDRAGEVGWGTEIWGNVHKAISLYGTPARVIVVTDEQSADSADQYGFPANVPLYFFNLGGYGKSTVPAAGRKQRYNFGGLTDHTFQLIPLLERGASGDWPF